MKTVQINSVCQYGSTGKIAVDISRGLTEDGVENYIFYGVGDSTYKKGIKFGSNLNVTSHQIKTRLLGKHGFYSKHATKELIEKLRGLRPDLIHLHNLHGHYLNVELLFEFLKEINKPVIWTLHDCWSFTGHCSHFDYIGCLKWKTHCFSCPQLREYPKSLIFDRSKESFFDKKRLFSSLENMTIVTPSKWLKGLVEESFLKHYPVVVINGGIELDIFKPIKSDFRQKHNIEDKFILLAVANYWTEKKGYHHILNLSNMIGEDEVIVIVGVSEEQRKDLPYNIIGITKTYSLENLVEIYSAADVCVNPTLEETLSLINIESLACATPVITFNTGGSPETIDEETGIVVKRDDLMAMVDAKNKIKALGKDHYKSNCIKRAQTHFNKQDMYDNYKRLYSEMLENKS